eukprot:TRINITY_DN26886_c0_g1_i1.p1 TRINITY_DN26886_c0_g1~~TRINITY_DN26886_c0_g1_i1.p1  ORF type:complete len:462 (+),score=54.99 TRINITY_DN26886_c0_g1_i1:92-1477(+)
MIRRPPRSTLSSSSAASDVYKRQVSTQSTGASDRQMAPHESISDNLPLVQEPQTVYLTGGSGFLGGQLLRDLTASPERFGKIYLPVRTKKGMSGQERFDALFGAYGKTCVYCNAADPIPQDTTTIILNAYSISFQNDVQDTLRDNVAPMLALLDQCVKLPDVRHVVAVSTAYVQPFLPFKMCKAPIPCHASQNPEKAYQDVLSGKITWAQLQADPVNHQHTTQNAYVYSKTLMEHVVTHRYKDSLPLSIVRPSIISCSSDGSYGSRFTPPCAMGMLSQSKVARCFPGTAHADHVHVDHVSQFLLDTASAVKTRGEVPVCLATGNSAIIVPDFKHNLQGSAGCYSLFFDLRKPVNVWLIWLLRTVELLVYRVVLGKKMASLIGTVYYNYDHFLTETWDFEPNLPIELDSYYAAMNKWLAENPPPKPKSCSGSPKASKAMMGWSLLLVPMLVLISCILVMYQS